MGILVFPQRLGAFYKSQGGLGNSLMKWKTEVDSSWFPARGDSPVGPWECLPPEIPGNPDSLCYVLPAMFANLRLWDRL